MKKVLLFLLAAPLFAQTLTPTASLTSLRAGQSTVISFTLSGAGQNVGMQWDVQRSNPSVVISPPIAGAAAVAASKSVVYGSSRFIVYGVNAAAQGVIPNGVLATSVFTIPAGTPAGPITVTVVPPETQVTGAATGSNFIGGPPLTLTVLPAVLTGDLNGDGVVNNADVILALSQALKAVPCTNADITGPVAGSAADGSCDIYDIVAISKQVP